MQRKIGDYLPTGVSDAKKVPLRLRVTATGVTAAGDDSTIVKRASEKLKTITAGDLKAWGVFGGGRKGQCEFSYDWRP